MTQRVDVDTGVLRAMAVKVRRVVADLEASDLRDPVDAGHERIVAAGAEFGSAWSRGLAARVTDSEDFADRLEATARVFDEGENAAKAELDAMIWGL